MIIRSQDKKNIINFDNASNIYMQGTEIWANIYHGIVKLGVYSNEEKALNVLDRMCDHNFWNCDVYQMPQDSEV